MGGRAVECTGLEIRRVGNGTVSSNLTPSAKPNFVDYLRSRIAIVVESHLLAGCHPDPEPAATLHARRPEATCSIIALGSLCRGSRRPLLHDGRFDLVSVLLPQRRFDPFDRVARGVPEA